MDLYLVRHAIAFDFDTTQWPDDSKRPLTREGQKKFGRAARGLKSLVPAVDLVLCSPWLRAWQTAELLERKAGWPRPLACEALAAGRSPAGVLHVLQPYASYAAVALVGHEPSLHALASYLLTADTDAQVEMRKGGVARIEVGEALRPGAGKLHWLLPPKVLRALAR